ncbi:hypothetical protein GCM10023094_28800 [Rhodococcus olei]|uniref:Uncharacterized protein n=1 Tax=Rhodococcus olei TaxID=2161675 RepID=A0ABP8P459_9NOCA
MKIPMWLGAILVIALSIAEAALELERRAVGATTRALIRGRGTDTPEGLANLVCVEEASPLPVPAGR